MYRTIQARQLTFGEGNVLLGLAHDVHRIHLRGGSRSSGGSRLKNSGS
jgi:hypothetical protein